MKLTAKNISIIAAVLFTVGCLYSALVEEIIPYWKSGNKHQFWIHIIGVPVCIFGTLVFCYGGFIYAKSILFGLFVNEQVIENVEILRSKKSLSKGKARIQNLKLFFQYSKLGCLWLTLGFSIITLGAYIINYI